MSHQPPDNSEPQQPDASSRQQADSSIPQNVVQGNQNRAVQGNDNQSVLGDGNTVVQGNNNLMLVVKELIFGQQLAPVGNPAREHNQRLLLADVKQEVTARLRQSLHNAVLINLGKESQPQQVKRPWDAEIKIGLKPAVPLPDTTTILQVFDSTEIAGKLLILGEPGSGKTTTQLELAQALVSRAEEQPDYPVPVLFNLSSWKDDRQPLADWLVAELKSKHCVPIKLGKDWVDNKQLLPLLDGLDELEPQRQEICVDVINQFLTSEIKPLYLVVGSRSEEYRNYATQLQINGAIYLQNLTTNQICDYLTSINSIGVWSTISSDLDLLDLVKTPLLLSITVVAFQEINVEQWQHLNSTAERHQYLLDAYVGQMLTRDINSRAYLKNKTPNARQTRMWLVWLAQQMQRESKTEFLIEEMQPNWIKKSKRFSYRLIFWLIAGLISGLYKGLIFWLSGGFDGLMMAGLIFLQITNNVTIDINEKVFIKKINQENIISMTLGLTGGLFAVLTNWLFEGLPNGLNKGLTYAVIGVVIGGLIYGFNGGLIGRQVDIIENKKYPNQGIWKSTYNTVFFGLIAGLTIGLFNGLFNGLYGGLVIGLYGGLTTGLSFGGITCIQHFTLRLILYHNGYIPWDYARFLNYSTERVLLQRVGGRYRFIHKLLQDHFAKMEFRRD
ncbi:MAG: NACHT domain-containing protein [Nostoc sp. CmiVER01]|uniref:NACHT domain-containing protein n=1 Tax=Nostoc sp. CmiVER01 TaxID=3075384 RepID=UPI002AD38B69|nr:NACHT domain-containing protein [Nostoc sp. CmiVER01]MDZ8126647.1 NACHT domain-containing protein [Nostoc sp. CmiVER01]